MTVTRGTTDYRRLVMAALLGGAAWIALSYLVNGVVLTARYREATAGGTLLERGRLDAFLELWAAILLVASLVVAWLHVLARRALGSGWRATAAVGLAVAFVAGVPGQFVIASLLPLDPHVPLWWAVEMGGGAIVAALAAGLVYRDREPRSRALEPASPER